jgi:hypothetical protein
VHSRADRSHMPNEASRKCSKASLAKCGNERCGTPSSCICGTSGSCKCKWANLYEREDSDSCSKSYRSYGLAHLQRASVLPCLTAIHEHWQLPSAPHFSQPHLRCLWPGFIQVLPKDRLRRLKKTSGCFINHVCSICSDHVYLFSAQMCYTRPTKAAASLTHGKILVKLPFLWSVEAPAWLP